MSEHTTFFQEALSSFVGSGVAVAVLGFLTSVIVKHRLSKDLEAHKSALTKETARQLELLKSELSRQASRETEILRSSLEVHSHREKFTREQVQQHRSRAIQETYNALQGIREQFRSIVGYLGEPIHQETTQEAQDRIMNQTNDAHTPLIEEALYFDYEAHRDLLALWRKVPMSLAHDFLDLSLARWSLHKDGKPTLEEIKRRSEKFVEGSSFLALSARLEGEYRNMFSQNVLGSSS